VKTAIIINPVAGRGKTDKLWPKLERVLCQRNYAYQAFFTKGPKDGINLANALQSKVERLVVVGGDGIIHEVVQGIVNREVELAIIPTGTGNDFVRSLGIPQEPLAALELLFEGRIRKVDVGEVNGSYFINVAGVGFDAVVVNEVNTNFKFVSGTMAYLLALFKTLATYQKAKVKVSVGKQTFKTDSLLVAVGNGQCYGGGMKIVPGAILDDGLLNLCIVGDVTKGEILRTLPKIFSGGHVAHPKVVMLKGEEISIEAQPPLVIQADGEIIGYAPAKIRVLPQALKVRVPLEEK